MVSGLVSGVVPGLGSALNDNRLQRIAWILADDCLLFAADDFGQSIILIRSKYMSLVFNGSSSLIPRYSLSWTSVLNMNSNPLFR